MFKKIALYLGLALVLAVGGIAAYATTKPDSFRVERSTTIAAPPDKIVAHIADFRAWAAWSPFDKYDPAMRKTYSGAPSGKGAMYGWSSEGDAGAGRMEILEASPSKVVIKLDFLQPFEAHNTAEFTLVPEGEGTRVTWSMHGPSPFVSKVMQVFVDMDDMVGKDFDAGLASLKTVAEKS